MICHLGGNLVWNLVSHHQLKFDWGSWVLGKQSNSHSQALTQKSDSIFCPVILFYGHKVSPSIGHQSKCYIAAPNFHYNINLKERERERCQNYFCIHLKNTVDHEASSAADFNLRPSPFFRESRGCCLLVLFGCTSLYVANWAMSWQMGTCLLKILFL